MRVGVALILPKFIGENGIFYAEICAWSGAAVLLILSYGIIIQKHKNKTDGPIYPHENSTGIYRTEKISSILIYTFLYLMFHDFPTLLHFSCKFQTVIPIDRRIRIGNDIQHFLINNEHSVNGSDIPA